MEFKDNAYPITMISIEFGSVHFENRTQFVHWLEQHGFNNLDDFINRKNETTKD